MSKNNSKSVRLDHKVIFDLVEPKSNVLDLGCGDGDLLSMLIEQKSCKGTGIEINEKGIYKSIAKGLTVSHEDINYALKSYPDKRFDYVILNESLQEVLDPKENYYIKYNVEIEADTVNSHLPLYLDYLLKLLPWRSHKP